MSENGSATAVALLHGWPVTAAHWRHLTPALAAAGLLPVPVTLPGLGVAPEAGVASFRKTDLARWALTYLADRGITRFAIVGHDWGATVGYLIAAACPAAVSALIVEEEILPGVDAAIPEPGRERYPGWHGPFNCVPGLAEALVPGREAAYYGAFLRQSAGAAGLDPEAVQSYLDAYTAPGILEAGLGYYRTRDADVSDVRAFSRTPVDTPVLALGGRYAMGAAVAAGMRQLAGDVTGLILEQSGHYPVEQEPGDAADAIVNFIVRVSGGPSPAGAELRPGR